MMTGKERPLPFFRGPSARVPGCGSLQIGATNKADLNLFFVTGAYFQPGRLGESSYSRKKT
jgi:hypothetical protein